MIEIKYLEVDKGDFSLKIDSLDLSGKGCVVILGPNGSGKTTLGSCLSKVIRYKGMVKVDNKDIQEIKGYNIQNYVGASLDREYKDLLINTEDFLEVSKESVKREYQDKRIGDLSSGEFQMIDIERVLGLDSRVVILDEPTANLDIKNKLEVIRVINSIAEDKLLILITHDIQLAYDIADVVIIMKNGKIVSKGKKQDVMTSKSLEQVYGVEFKTYTVGEGKRIIVTNLE